MNDQNYGDLLGKKKNATNAFIIGEWKPVSEFKSF